MMTLFRKIFWVALFLVFTLGFVTWFDHGYVTSHQFTADARGEVSDLMDVIHPPKAQKDPGSDPAK